MGSTSWILTGRTVADWMWVWKKTQHFTANVKLLFDPMIVAESHTNKFTKFDRPLWCANYSL